MERGGGISPHFRISASWAMMFISTSRAMAIISRGWLLSSNASLVNLGLHLGKILLSKEDRNVFAEHQGQVTLGDEMSIHERDCQIIETSCQIQQSFARKAVKLRRSSRQAACDESKVSTTTWRNSSNSSDSIIGSGLRFGEIGAEPSLDKRVHFMS